MIFGLKHLDNIAVIIVVLIEVLYILNIFLLYKYAIYYHYQKKSSIIYTI